MIRLTLLFATLAIALPFVISYVATPAKVGIDVSERFLERSDEMPAGRAEDDTPAKKLKYWVENENTKE